MEEEGADSHSGFDSSSPTVLTEDGAISGAQLPFRETFKADKEPIDNSDQTNGLSRVLSRVRSHTSHIDPGPPPDGGLQAWSQSFVAHLIVFNTWGYIQSFGVFQTYYVAILRHPPSDISWVGSTQIFLLFFVGTFSGRATDGGYFRTVFIAGSILQLVGVFTTSLSTRYWQIFLAQGLCSGLGNGLVFCPTLSLVSTYFTKNRSLAIAIAASGSATGGLVIPALVEVLLPKLGFPWTMRVLGFVMLALQAISLTLVRTRLPPRRTGPLIEWAAFKELPYTLFAIGMFLIFWGLYFAFYYIGSFGHDVIGVSEADAINLLLVANGVGMVGRIAPAYIADQFFGPLNTILPFSFISALLLYCWVAVTSRGGLKAFCVIYGLFAAGVQSMFPVTLSSLTTDLKKMGVRMGMVFSVISFACLTGPPLAGALIQKDGGGYLYAQIFAGTALMCGCFTLLVARIAKAGLKFRIRV